MALRLFPMRLIRKVFHPPAYYNARAQDARIIASHRVKRCYVCTFEVPEADVVIEDGQERCPLCKDVMTAEWKAAEQERVAAVKVASAKGLALPPQESRRPLLERDVFAVTSITDSAGNFLSQSAPLAVKRNTATTVILNGQNATSAVSFTYPTGMSNNTAPVVTATRITLSIITTAGMATGAYSLTVNDGLSTYGHVYTNIFAVR